MNTLNRRQFLRAAGLTVLAANLASTAAAKKKSSKSQSNAAPVSVPGTLVRSDLSRCAPASRLSRDFADGRWQLLDYETVEGVSGVMVAALPEHDCGELTLPLDASGLYKIYFGINYTKARYHEWPAEGQLEVKLDGDGGFRRVGAESGSVDDDDEGKGGRAEGVHKAIKETYWKTADVTGRKLTLRQPNFLRYLPEGMNIANLSYVKLVPLSPDETRRWRKGPGPASTRNVAVLYCTGSLSGSTKGTAMFHPTDQDWFKDEFEAFANSDIGLFVFEALRGNYCVYRSKIGDVGAHGNRWEDDWIDPLAEFTRLAHLNGIKIFSSLRMIGPQFPMNREPIARASHYWKHPEWSRVSRNGARVSNWSFAFPEARAYWLSLLRETLDYGTDGIQLHLNRSTPVVLYEEPVVRSFKEKYGEDPRKLDEKDPRWLAHGASYLTTFIQEVRALLDEKPGRELGVTVLSNEKHSDYDPIEVGCDVMTWLRQGWVNYVMPSPDANLALLAKWRAAGGSRVHLCPDLMPRAQPAASYAELAKRYYAAGADGLSLWDGNARPPRISEWAAVQQLGHRDRLDRIIAEGPSYAGSVMLKTLAGFSVAESFHDG